MPAITSKLEPLGRPALPSDANNEGSRWMLDHAAELVERYCNQWVAVHRDRVVSSGTDLARVLDEAKSIAPEQDIVVDFIADATLILAQS